MNALGVSVPELPDQDFGVMRRDLDRGRLAVGYSRVDRARRLASRVARHAHRPGDRWNGLPVNVPRTPKLGITGPRPDAMRAG